jgi:hypothetical protein
MFPESGEDLFHRFRFHNPELELSEIDHLGPEVPLRLERILKQYLDLF